jgi:hypothetical protein
MSPDRDINFLIRIKSVAEFWKGAMIAAGRYFKRTCQSIGTRTGSVKQTVKISDENIVVKAEVEMFSGAA